MSIQDLRVINLRVIEDASVSLTQGINWFHGPNGSGKTTLIESLHLLATGRTLDGKSELESMIRDGETHLSIQVTTKDGSRLALEKTRGEERRLTGPGKLAIKHQSVARRIPMISDHQRSHLLVDGPPVYRRRFLDWGLFHQQASYSRLLTEYNRLLKQRNLSLKQAHVDRLVRAWDAQLSSHAEQIHRLREAHLRLVEPYIRQKTSRLLPGYQVELALRRGWSRSESLESVLSRTLDTDRRLGYTGAGAHRADLIIKVDGHAVRERLSRGERRRLAIALRLAQMEWFWDNHDDKDIVCLLDDFGADLDQVARQEVFDLIENMQIQTFITTTSPPEDSIAPHRSPMTVFHVKHGRVERA